MAESMKPDMKWGYQRRRTKVERDAAQAWRS